MKPKHIVLLLALVIVLDACGDRGQPTGERFDHIVVVIEENRSAAQVRDLPYLAELRSMGTELTQYFGLYRPSQPNYIALFSGSMNGVASNADYDISTANIYTRLVDAGFRFLSFAQSLPYAGYRGTSYGAYRRRHNPVASFTTAPDSINRSFGDFPVDEAGFAALPALSLVVPDLDNDMHDGTPEAADQWLRDNLGAYASWARTHRSLLVLTFDEPDTSADLAVATILTIFVGEGLPSGTTVSQRSTHYTLLKFLLDEFGAPSLGLDAGEAAFIFPY